MPLVESLAAVEEEEEDEPFSAGEPEAPIVWVGTLVEPILVSTRRLLLLLSVRVFMEGISTKCEGGGRGIAVDRFTPAVSPAECMGWRCESVVAVGRRVLERLTMSIALPEPPPLSLEKEREREGSSKAFPWVITTVE
jgi:hypothetical protein